jgi:aminoglycoside phosphotransferase (APT) family kinase protein
MDLEACLPANLRLPSTTVTKLASGLSGAGVYKVVAGAEQFVLKVSRTDVPFDDWRRHTDILLLAANAGVAPRVVHVDEHYQSVLSEFVADRSFPAFFHHPQTRAAAVALLGRTIRKVHKLPQPSQIPAAEPKTMLEAIWRGPLNGVAMPPFVSRAVRDVLTQSMPERDRPLVLSHNDVNPSNLTYDGERLLLLDWDVAAPNDVWYDLATIAVFSRMDDATCAGLIAAYDGASPAELPPTFRYFRRLIASLCGSMFLQMAYAAGHRATDGDRAPTLAEFYEQMRSGSANLAAPEGKWRFGLALIGTV